MSVSLEPVDKLVRELARLPGVGTKSAQRLAFHMLMRDGGLMKDLAGALLEAKERVKRCGVCGNLATERLCPICADPKRSAQTLCVVRDARDVLALEKAREFRGKYHILGGVLSPVDGIGPEQLSIEALLKRISSEGVQEVIIATNPDVEGEATALYLARAIKPLGVRVTRIAHGVPIGGNLEYVDEITLSRALSGRRPMD